ncbi:Rz-like spanin [Vibrio phage D479]
MNITQIGMAALLAAALVSGGFAYVQTLKLEAAHTKIEGLRTDLADAHTANGELSDQMQNLSAQYERRNEIISDYSTVTNDLRSELAKKDAVINKYKGRQHVVFQKPKLVERMEQRAMQKFFDKVANK